jgi:hypothetical protein
VTAIERAWRAVEARDATALRQCIAAMELARTVLVDASVASLEDVSA